MEWVDGNMGSGMNMKYPCCVLEGDRARGTVISVAYAAKDQFRDTGAKMIHIGANTTSTIISKSICKGGGKVNYRGMVKQLGNAKGARSHVECDTLILDDKSTSDTIPFNESRNSDVYLEHEASVSKVNEDKYSIAFVRRSDLTEEMTDKVKIIKIDTITASDETIADASYPLTLKYFIIASRNLEDESVSDMYRKALLDTSFTPNGFVRPSVADEGVDCEDAETDCVE
jgi:hypothetical protein